MLAQIFSEMMRGLFQYKLGGTFIKYLRIETIQYKGNTLEVIYG